MLRRLSSLLGRLGFIAILGTVAATGSACRRADNLPGTEIPDTPDARAVLEVIEKYRVAFLRKDAAAIWALAHISYRDEAGTDDPSDDVDYEALGALLRERLGQIDSLRFAIDYVSLQINGDRAVMRVWIDASFRMKPILAPDGKPREQSSFERQQDFSEFALIRENGLWRFTKGL